MHDPDAVDATRRTRLANERTYLAWLRSAMTALAVAFGAGKIVPGVAHLDRRPFEIVGAGFALLGLAFVGAGVRRFLMVEAALEAGEFAPLRRRDAVVLAAAAGLLGGATLVLVFVR